MGLFGPTVIREFEDKEPGYYFQVFLTRPKENKAKVNPTRMWETEKEALMDLPYIIPKLIERDSREPDSFCITDASILVKTIFIAKLEKPAKMGMEYSKIEDIEQDSLQRYLNKNNIMFKVKLQNSLVGASRNKIINIAIMDIRDSLKDTEFTRKCVKYTFKDDGISYERFVTGFIDSINLASYDAYIGIPNPRRNVELLDKFYSELHNAVNAANMDILKMGFKINLLGGWDRGNLILEPLAVSIGESNIIYEDPSNLKIDGQPVDDEGEEEDNTDYSIQDEPEEDDTQTEDEPTEEDTSTDEVQPEEGENSVEAEDEPEEDETATTDYRIPDNADDDTTEGQPDEADTQAEDEPEDGTDDQGEDQTEGEDQNAEEEAEEGEDDASTDYRVNSDDAEDNSGEGEDNNSPEGDQDSGDAQDGDSTDDDQDNNENEAKAQEDEIFSDLSPEQRRIQDEELKENYVKLYNTIGDLINRLEQITTNNSTREPLTFVQNQLIELKDFVFKYLSEVYSTKTYIENNINYQQYLAILSNINNLLTQLTTKSVDID